MSKHDDVIIPLPDLSKPRAAMSGRPSYDSQHRSGVEALLRDATDRDKPTGPSGSPRIAMENAKATPPSPSDGITADSVSGPRFTVRQREVLDLLCKGLADKTISRRMKISLGTVKTHVAGVLRKLGVSSRLQAVVSTRDRHDLDHGAQRRPAHERRTRLAVRVDHDSAFECS